MLTSIKNLWRRWRMTNRELLMMLDGDLGERAVKNCISEYGKGEKYLDKQYSYGRKISQSLLYAFAWMDSPEKYMFWAIIYNELIDLGL